MVQFITLPQISNYTEILQLMEDRVAQVINKSWSEIVYLLEHDNVYTAGLSALPSELLNIQNNIPIIYTGRGGKFTYHGIGQRVIYPILDLSAHRCGRDIKKYISMLEQWIINVLNYVGVEAYILDGLIGIWVKYRGKDAKIAAIGVRVKKWVAYHGIALNIFTDLDKFSAIIPCGLSDFTVTSLEQLGIKIQIDYLDQIIQQEFNKVFT
jgi:lipoyl(octanoyl) transferase